MYYIISNHIILYHIISYYIILYYIISYHIISYYIVLYHIIPYHIILYCIISYHTISYHIILYYIILYYIISYHIILYYINLLYHTYTNHIKSISNMLRFWSHCFFSVTSSFLISEISMETHRDAPPRVDHRHRKVLQFHQGHPGRLHGAPWRSSWKIPPL